MSARLTTAVLLALGLTFLPANAQLVGFVTESFTNDIAPFDLNTITGAVSFGAPVPSGGLQPWAMAIAPSLRQAYVVNRGSNNVACFAIQLGIVPLALPSGTLILEGTAPTGSGPIDVQVDPTQRFIYVENFDSNTISAFSIGHSCAMTPIGGSPFPTGLHPFAGAFDPNAFRLYVTNFGANTISIYQADLITGALVQTSNSPLPTGTNPTGVVFDQMTRDIFEVNQATKTINIFSSVDLHLIGTAPTGSMPTDVGIVDPFFYDVNSADNTVSGFLIGATGSLTPTPGSPYFTGGHDPMSVAFDPNRAYATVPDFASNDLAVFRINPTTGALTPVPGSPFPVPLFDPTSVAMIRADLQPPIITKHFGSNSIPAGGTTTLTFTITNPNQNAALRDIAFEDVLAGFNATIPSGPLCGGSGSLENGFFVLDGGELSAGGTCLFILNLTATTASGPVTNTTNEVASNAPSFGAAATASITVGGVVPFTVATTFLPNGRLDTPYNTTLSTNGGIGQITWAATGLPTGLSLSPTTGVISGLPTQQGTNTIGLTATDSTTPTHQIATANLPLTILPVHLNLDVPGVATVGEPFSITVHTLDSNNQPVTNFAGSVHFSSTDPKAIFPAGLTLGPGGQGSSTVTLGTAGSWTITAAVDQFPTITGTSPLINAVFPHLAISPIPPVASGVSVDIQVTALDASNHVFTGFPDFVAAQTSDTKAVLPAAPVPFIGGIANLPVIFNTPGPQSLTATDTGNPAINATTSVNVTAPTGGLTLNVTPFGVLTPGQPANLLIASFLSVSLPVTLSTSDPSIVSLVPPGTSSLQFNLGPGGKNVSIFPMNFGNATLSATSPGLGTSSITLQVGETVNFIPSNITINGTSNQKSVSLFGSGVVPVPVTFNLFSDNPSVVTLMPTVTMPPNSQSIVVPIFSHGAGSTQIHATTNAPNVAGATANVTVIPGLTSITPASLPDATVGVPYSAAITAAGGTAPYSVSLIGGILPPGIILDGTGHLGGIPTAPVIKTPLQFLIRDASAPQQSAEADVTLTVKQ